MQEWKKKTFENWLKIKNTSRQILDMFDFVYANDYITSKRLLSLGINEEKLFGVVSSKEQSKPLTYDLKELNKFKKIFRNRKVWVAASTHVGEEQILGKAQKILNELDKNFLLILVPRHPDRGMQIFKKLTPNGQITKIRSKRQNITKETSIYLADTLGELGLWYNLSNIVFLGGSLVKIGGHNPFEPIRFGSAIISGPYIFNFKEAFDQLENRGALITIRNTQELVEIIKTLSNKNNAHLIGQKGLKYINSLSDKSSKIISTINNFT